MTFTNGGWYDINTTTANPALGVNRVTTAPTHEGCDFYYTLDGLRINKPRKNGIYIYKGHKIVVR